MKIKHGLSHYISHDKALGRNASVVTAVQAGVERLQWPPRRIRVDTMASAGESGLRRMRATRRGALEGFPLPQLRRRVAAMLAAGHDVTFIGQAGESGTRVMARRPVARWVAARG